MKFLVDAQLPRRLADWLRQQRHDVVHTLDLAEQNRTPDSSLLTRANSEMRTIVTKDSDFQLSFELGKGPPRLLLVTTGNMHNDELIELFSKHATTIFDLLSRHTFIEVGRFEIIVHH